MLKRLFLAAALAAGLASPALAQSVPQVIATCGIGVSLPLGPGGRLFQDQTGILCTTAGSGGGGGGGATGSVTAAGTNGSAAQAVQGITGGVPQNGFTGQYNSTLPTFTNAQVGYVALDSNGRQILSPISSVLADIRVGGAAVATGNPVPVNIVSGGSSGSAGSVTAAGTNGTQAQAVQGITGGIPQNSFPAQYNSTLPTFASGSPGYLSVDSNGRMILAPGASVSVSNFPATQAVSGTVAVTQSTSPWVVSNGGTFAVQNTAAVVGGNATAVKTDSSATTQPISAAALPLPTGATTAANQATEITALQAIQQRAAVFPEQSGASVAASATVNGTSRDAGASPLYSKFNVVAFSNQAGTIYLQGSNDNFATLVGVANSAVTANAQVIMTVPTLFRYNRYVFINGSTAATVSINTSYTAN